MYNIRLRDIRIHTVAVEKAVSITYSDCVFVALVIQHAKCMQCMTSVACLVLPYFFTLSHKQSSYKKKFLTQNVFFDFLYSFGPKHYSF
jgi:hypothetical protein